MFRTAAAVALLLPLLGLTPRQELKVEVLDKLKSATVYVVVNDGGMKGTGSGFLFLKRGTTGYIMTCEHVVGGAPTVKVVFWSGTAQEKTYTAKVVATDPHRDIACLIVREIPGMPAPLELGKKTVVRETENVFAAGFPFGAMLADGDKNPEISVSKSSVTSLRRNEAGDLSRVQISGEVNPGNSGGPLVSGDGRVIGVTSAKIMGTQTAFAVPAEEIQGFLQGRVKASTFRKLEGSPTKSKYEVVLDLVDPLATLKNAGIAYIEEKEIKGEPEEPKDGGWKKIHPGMKSVSMKIDEDRAVHSLDFAPSKVGNSAEDYVYQCYFTRADGQTIWTEPAVATIYFRAGADAPTDRRPGARRPDPPSDTPEPPAPPDPPAGPMVELKLPDEVPFSAQLEAQSVFGGLLLAPDGSALYALDLSEGQVYKLDPEKLEIQAKVDIADTSVAMALSPNGKILIVAGRAATTSEGKGFDGPTGILQIINLEKFTIGTTLAIKGAPVELVVTDAGLVAATTRGQWGGLIVYDIHKKTEDGVHLIYGGGSVRLSRDQRRVYVGDNGLSPPDYRCLPLRKDKGEYVPYDSVYHGDHPLGGLFELSPDGKHLVGSPGSILRLAKLKDSDLRYVAKIDPFQSAAMAEGSSTLLTFTADGMARCYSIENFTLVKSVALPERCIDAVLDVKRRKVHGVFCKPSQDRMPRVQRGRPVEAGKLASFALGGP